ncbi:MAG TPA: heme ABC transporter ATP-binding protein, partial [Firmicutes bacterium]|nr:heme ABC transporter ATP-binding protein [Bacillota bacterium]
MILDEPTAVLTPQEASELIAVLRGMAQAGKSLVFISHKMNEVMAVSDRVTVLRAGAVVGTVPTSEASPESLATMMVGRKIEAAKRTGEASCGKAVLELDQVWANADNDLPALKGLSLTVR